jgi:hypothetical protein
MLLAAILQVLPLCRHFCAHPAVASSAAIVFRWGVGATATLGAYDAVSGATNVLFTCPTTATGTVGTTFFFKASITNNGGDKGAVFSALPLPPGLTSSTFDNPPPVSNVYGIISGMPTQPTNNMLVTMVFSGKEGWGTTLTNLRLTILAAAPPSPPTITNNPASQTNAAGSTIAFAVGVNSATPPGYQWRFNGVNLQGQTSSTLTLPNVRTNQSGDYTVVVTNGSGLAVTSSPAAHLEVVVPPAPRLTLQPAAANEFRFSFNPVAGLTNTILTNASPDHTGWGVMTNIPPPASTSSIIITDTVSSSTKLYRVKFDP